MTKTLGDGVRRHRDIEQTLGHMSTIAVERCGVPLGIRVKLILDDLKDRYGIPIHGSGSLQEQAAAHKWGMTMDETVELIGRIDKMPDMDLVELHYHLSRMDNKASDFAAMAREMIVWTDEIRKKTGWTAPSIDIGGGWSFGRPGGTGPERRDDENVATFEDYGTEVCDAIKDECKKRDFPLPKLKMEPGHSISGSAGVAIARIGTVTNPRCSGPGEPDRACARGRHPRFPPVPHRPHPR